MIVEEEQKGEAKAEYGRALIKELSKILSCDFGKGFTPTNLKYMRQFYLTFPIYHAVRDKSHVNDAHPELTRTQIDHAVREQSGVNALQPELSWTHYRLLLKVEKSEARNFYIRESIENKWSTRRV